MHKPRYERMLPLVGLVVLGLLVVFLLESDPNNPLVARISSDLPVISVAWMVIGVLVIVISTGAEILARKHPQLEHSTLLTLPGRLRSIEIAPLFWILPSLTVVASFAFFRLFRDSLQGMASVLVLLTSSGALTATLVAQHYDLDRNLQVREKAKVGLQIVAYLVAFGLFSSIMYGRFRALLTAGLIGAVSVPLAYRLLARSVNDHRRPLTVALGVVGVVLAETSVILTYWPAPFLVQGTVLLALFYVVVSTLQHDQAGTLNRRIGIELACLGLLVLLVLGVATLR